MLQGPLNPKMEGNALLDHMLKKETLNATFCFHYFVNSVSVCMSVFGVQCSTPFDLGRPGKGLKMSSNRLFGNANVILYKVACIKEIVDIF